MYGSVIYGPRGCAGCQNGYDGEGRDEIATIQTALATLGYLTAAQSTGQYGARTYEAVREFQGDYGLTSDGRVGPSTLGVLIEQQARRAQAKAAVEGIGGSEGVIAKQDLADPLSPGILAQITTHKMFYPALIGSVLLIGGAVYWKRKK